MRYPFLVLALVGGIALIAAIHEDSREKHQDADYCHSHGWTMAYDTMRFCVDRSGIVHFPLEPTERE